ncbi:MAG: HAD-IIA family hydrolase [Devosiaceae bacterium]|nr:HAD-IIA family hydrolase [Devosiaceae bacterium]
MVKVDSDWAFAQYERVRQVLPKANFPTASIRISHIIEISEQFDVFLLDAFGVLNVGQEVIPGAPEWVGALQSAGKKVLVVANGATFSPSVSLKKYQDFGFDFDPRDIIASRNVLADALNGRDEKLWGVMASTGGAIDELSVNCIQLGQDPADFERVEGFIFLGSGEWTLMQQAMIVASLQRRPRPVFVGNPDIVAPRETGLSLEAGWFAHEIARKSEVVPQFFGKPFENIYQRALQRVGENVALERVVMVGDTLHTDVLGGAAAGVKSVLMADYGLFAGLDVDPFIATSGIVPDYILTQTSL